MTDNETRAWRRPAVAFTLVLLGSLLCQAAWALAIPPFRGLDEHDHAYKAAAVSRGDWAAHHSSSPQGWGEFVRVPPDLVAAAQPVCEALPYTTPDNCTPAPPDADGLARVASSAARYNPIFYFAMGAPARDLEGSHALYGMRSVAGLLCALLIALAAAVTTRWSRTRWPAASLLLAATPTFSYSTAVAAPNGIEMAGAMVVWASVLGLVREGGRPHRLFLITATVGALPLVTVRALGPLWLALIALVLFVLMPRNAWKSVARDPVARWCAGIVGSVAVAAASWTWWAGTNSPGAESGEFGTPSALKFLTNWILWFFQAVAAFPARDEIAPLAIYAVVFVAWWAMGAVALRFATGRERIAAALVLALGSAVPVAIMARTYDQLGAAWQGRYGYPLCMGAILIGGLALDRSTPLWRDRTWPLWWAAAATMTAQLTGQLHVLSTQSESSPLADTAAWLQPNPAALSLLTVLGVLLWTAGLGFPRTRSNPVDSVDSWPAGNLGR